MRGTRAARKVRAAAGAIGVDGTASMTGAPRRGCQRAHRNEI